MQFLEPDRVTVVLQEDGPFPTTKAFLIFVLTFPKHFLPLLGSPDNTNDFLSVHPVFDDIFLGDDFSMVPFTHGTDRFIFGSRN